ncbi:protein-tyrosine phosphatase family protein [Teredinibacter turnerae]|uniref:protein-tyrosine phosphatase family protein n=1 Tax=Teredinibacter turnerae TaxID=2426 RepID=UPI00056667FB|nr:protein-tyrosine phosphatase family protein [Teredinibacter turnerae]
MTPDIYKVELIGSGSLWVMAKPVSGDWIDDEFAGIANWGINRIVSLLEPHEEIEVGLSEEKLYTEKYGMEFVSFPKKDRGLPNSIQEYLAFTKRLYHEAAGGLNTVVHCRAGIGRTGIIAAGVLLHCGFEPTEAIEHISKQRGVAVPDTEEQIEWVIRSHAQHITNCST